MTANPPIHTLTQPLASVPLPTTTTTVTGSTAAARNLGGLTLTMTVGTTGIIMWATSLGGIRMDSLGDYGLPPALPVRWYAGLALLVIGHAGALCQRRSRPWLLAGFLTATVVVLYGTVPLCADVPHYPWVYKHIGVVRYIDVHGSIDPGIDIYHRWPGFFAVATLFGRLAGQRNPVTYAAWAEVFFPLVQAGIVAATARTLTGRTRTAATAAFLFVVTNWVGQSYFAPQAFGLTMGLGLYLVALRFLGTRRPTVELTAVTGKAARRTAITIICMLQAAVVVSHQLTPYLIVAGMGALSVAGYLRPRWLTLVLAGLALAWLAPNLGYVEHNFGLLSGANPVANATNAHVHEFSPQPGKIFNARAGYALTASVCLLAIIGAWRGLRRGERAVGIALVLAVVPVGIVFAQNYGGEASLRVVLFALPFASVLGALALEPTDGGWRLRQMPSVSIVTGALVAMFLPAFTGQEEINIMTPDTVRAADYFDTHAATGSVLLLAGPDFPLRYGPRYPEFRSPGSDDDPNLLHAVRFRNRQLGAADLDDVVTVLRQYSTHGYLAFATSQDVYADVFGLTPPGALNSLEDAVARSPRFQVFFTSPTARIYTYQANR
ncbi:MULTISPECIES: hypothetical protein [unclassified Frankia]|uniref:hypothetical protein n=1 Tax=unclassified Frankia TaxID=2632575 RepID=UPI002AD46F09|nr:MULTISPECIES: hypothetical protein [unclassified Frankia]